MLGVDGVPSTVSAGETTHFDKRRGPTVTNLAGEARKPDRGGCGFVAPEAGRKPGFLLRFKIGWYEREFHGETASFTFFALRIDLSVVRGTN